FSPVPLGIGTWFLLNTVRPFDQNSRWPVLSVTTVVPSMEDVPGANRAVAIVPVVEKSIPALVPKNQNRSVARVWSAVQVASGGWDANGLTSMKLGPRGKRRGSAAPARSSDRLVTGPGVTKTESNSTALDTVPTASHREPPPP